MKIPNYDIENAGEGCYEYKQMLRFMPDKCFRMLICCPSGSGKTNTLMYMIYNLLYYDKIYLYAKNLEQSKYQSLLKTFKPISKEGGYDIIETSNDEIIAVSQLGVDNKKIVIFDDYVCEKNQKPLVDYFIRGRHNCSVIYLSQSYYKALKDIRPNCSHFCIYDSPSANERSLICRENNIAKEEYKKATEEPYTFIYLDKPRKFTAKNFNEKTA